MTDHKLYVARYAAAAIGRRRFLQGAAAIGGLGVLGTACSSGDDADDTSTADATGAAAPAPGEPGRMVRIGFSAPGADHGWLRAITTNAQEAASEFSDLELIVTEGNTTSELQIGQVQQLIDQDVDALIILPQEGQALTDIAIQAQEAGIPVVNLDRIFDSPLAYRTWIGGDNYGMGASAGNFIGRELGEAGGKVVEIQGIASLQLTQDRSQGFADALANYPNVEIVQQADAEFTAESGQAVMETVLQAQSDIQAIWNHDDDQGVGVEAAIAASGRQDEFFMVGGAGSRNVMQKIKDGELYRATVLYPPTMSGSAVGIARAVAQERRLDGLVEAEVPKLITLYSSTVTQENVDRFIDLGFES